MGRRCCIAGCNSTSRLPEHHGVTYHSFPLDQGIRSIWIRNTRLNMDRQITKSVLVCSRHFRRADFQPQRSGKYLLKQKVFPTVFPWGKVDAAQVEADLEALKNMSVTPTNLLTPSSTIDEDTKATVAATVAQIMAQTAELNAAAGIRSSADKSQEGTETEAASGGDSSAAGSSASPCVKFEPVTSFNPGARLEVQDFDGVWHMARVVEVDNDDREVLIKFERSGKNKSAIIGTEEWIPMNSTRLRQKISTRPVPVFALDEKCMARWSGPRKFPGTVKKVLGNDMYEVLFDDGYVKNVRAIHMSKVLSTADVSMEASSEVASVVTATSSTSHPATPVNSATKHLTPAAASSSNGKKRTASGSRKDWPLLDMSKLDLASLNLPDIPHDGEWTCHWVNDQPIGKEGYLVVGEHRKPTVIVEDWRLPPGWIKHMYQRSNVLGKWDVILVTPSGKRFRSKSDLKVFLEEQGKVYNPDIYDFSIHRRRAKDINAYVYTPGYVPQQPPKPKSTLDSSLESTSDTKSALASSLVASTSTSQYIETPVAEPVPPMELMTSPPVDKSVPSVDAEVPQQLLNSSPVDVVPTATKAPSANKEETTASTATSPSEAEGKAENGFALIGGLKVQIIDNLFRCPQEGCSKNFRKENHLQIHVKHYHHDLIKLLGACPKMQELAEKRTHPLTHDANEPLPKNQISNQQFFAKLHQQDLEHTRAHRRSTGVTAIKASEGVDTKSEPTEGVLKSESADEDKNVHSAANNETLLNSTANSGEMEHSFTSSTANESTTITPSTVGAPAPKRSRFSPNKRATGSRKSSRQRTTRRYLTAAQATGTTGLVVTADSSFGGVTDFEETRHSFNATPDAGKKRKSAAAPATPATPLSSVDSPVTADSGSSSFQPLQAPSSNEPELNAQAPQYIKENGELIKIVRMRQEEIINCLCGYGEEDGLMIQCELCLCWQHGFCNGIDKESQVPEKYVCYICRNPQRARESMRFKHDQDWLYEGKLPVANYHTANPNYSKTAEFLKKSHTLTGNLIELRTFMHSLRVKINIANNRCHPKLYLWAKKWDDDVHCKSEEEVKPENQENETETKSKEEGCSGGTSPSKKVKSEPSTPVRPLPNIPQPEAPIDPVECQHRLLEHIKVQQKLVMERLTDIEAAIDELEGQDELPDLRGADLGTTKDTLAAFIKELDTMRQIAKLNTLEHTKQALKAQAHNVK